MQKIIYGTYSEVDDLVNINFEDNTLLILIVDFICLHKKLIIELDGGQHAEAQYYDDKRTTFLELKGYKV